MIHSTTDGYFPDGIDHDFRIANLLRDSRILEEAREDAFELVNRPEFLTADCYSTLRRTLKERWGSRLELANIG